jgi:HTH-type transcriptional regulator/antitoxin HigA
MVRKQKKTSKLPYEPDYAVPPGATLLETIDTLGIDQRELAMRSCLSVKHINQIIHGKSPISHESAIAFERVLGVPARFWNTLESNYQEQMAQVAANEKLKDELHWLKSIPVKELIGRHVVKESSDKLELLGEVLKFFGVASVEAWNDVWSVPSFKFRKSLKVRGKKEALATWLRLGELEAQKIECCPYDKDTFRSSLQEIRALTIKKPSSFVPKMISLCAQSGVALALVPEIKGAPVSGAAKWLTPSKAMICLNLRGKSNDRFWFTFFHEAGHIVSDSKRELYIDIDINYENDPKEHAANRFARNFLIPDEYKSELSQLTTHSLVVSFAESLGIAPGIVVGRLQREEIVSYKQFNSLKQKLTWASDANGVVNR